jgi:hypothetical protein
MFEKLTKPNESKKDFVYLVHTFFYTRDYSLDEISQRLDSVRDCKNRYDASIIGRVGSFNQIDTYGDFGVILSPKEKDLLVAWDADVFTPPVGTVERKNFFKWNTGRIKSLNSLLNCGYYVCRGAERGMGYNNLVLKGRKNNVPQAIIYHSTPEGIEGKENLAKLLPNVPQIDLGMSWKEGKLASKKREELSRKYLESMLDFSPKIATLL